MRLSNRIFHVSLLVVAFLLTACVKPVTRSELIVELNAARDMPSSEYNILWYNGTQDSYHYLTHQTNDKQKTQHIISHKELEIITIRGLTIDPARWRLVKSISDEWSAERKEGNRWVPHEISMDSGITAK